jgi:hypothetical protein
MINQPPQGPPQEPQFPQGPQFPEGPYGPQPPYGPQFGGQPPFRPQPPKKKYSGLKIACLSIIGVAVLFLAIGAIASAGSHSTSSNPAANSNPLAASQPSSPAPASQPTSSPAPVPTTPPPPAMTASQQSAIQAAEQYLQSEPGWSYQGLINQLDSPDGSGFSVADATFAVNNLSPTPNWNQQAAIAAQNYQSTVGGFSACSMVQQLDSPDGSDFTQTQAEYGAQAVGLGTC